MSQDKQDEHNTSVDALLQNAFLDMTQQPLPPGLKDQVRMTIPSRHAMQRPQAQGEAPAMRMAATTGAIEGILDTPVGSTEAQLAEAKPTEAAEVKLAEAVEPKLAEAVEVKLAEAVEPKLTEPVEMQLTGAVEAQLVESVEAQSAGVSGADLAEPASPGVPWSAGPFSRRLLSWASVASMICVLGVGLWQIQQMGLLDPAFQNRDTPIVRPTWRHPGGRGKPVRHLPTLPPQRGATPKSGFVVEMYHARKTLLGFRSRHKTRDGTRLSPGDLVQFSYESGVVPVYVLILSLNQKAEISPYVPLDTGLSLRVDGRGKLPKTGSLVLDGYLGMERIFVLYSSSPISLVHAKEWLRQTFLQVGGDLRQMRTLAGPWRVSTYLIHKQRR